MSLETWALVNSPEDLASSNYCELKESKNAGFTKDNSSIERVFLVHNTAIADFLDDVMGWSFWQQMGNEWFLRRIIPDQHPTYGAFWAHETKVEGMGAVGKNTDGSPKWDYYKVVVQYKPVPYAILKDGDTTGEWQRMCEFSYKTASEYITINAPMKLCTSGRTLATPPGKIIATTTLQVIWHQVPGKDGKPFLMPNHNQVIDQAGKLNMIGDGFADYCDCLPGSMLFLSGESKLVLPMLGQEKWFFDITLNFAIKDNGPGIEDDFCAGFNYIFDSASNRWDKATTTGSFFSGTKLYDENGDFASLFKYE